MFLGHKTMVSNSNWGAENQDFIQIDVTRLKRRQAEEAKRAKMDEHDTYEDSIFKFFYTQPLNS